MISFNVLEASRQNGVKRYFYSSTACVYNEALQMDPSIDRPESKNKPVQSIVERYVQLSAVKFVDEIIVYQTEKDLEDMLMFLPITIRIIGEEYKDKDFTGKQICEERAIKVFYNQRRHSFSTTELRKRVANKSTL
jgi:glycerol-3-phosphate cytidylyltransferase